jgi:hypothetical protein
MARLESGKVSPEQFDFANLRWDGGRYGEAALNRLKTRQVGADAAYIRDTASRALQATNRYAPIPQPKVGSFTNVTMRTPGAQLPASFLRQDWNGPDLGSEIVDCLRNARVRCDAWITDLDDDRKDEVLVLRGGRMTAYSEMSNGWRLVGSWIIPLNCKSIRDALRDGQFSMVAPERPRWPDMEILGTRVESSVPYKPVTCPS